MSFFESVCVCGTLQVAAIALLLSLPPPQQLLFTGIILIAFPSHALS